MQENIDWWQGFGRYRRHMADFTRLLLGAFLRDGGLQNAASLSYTTLLSLVPLMTVTLAVFSAFPISNRVGDLLQDFVFRNFVPTSGEILQGYLQQFSSHASKLSGAGFAFLILVALMMMATIERAFNIIWHVQRKRSFFGVFLVYWAILTLGPMLIGGSVALTSYFVSIPLFSGAYTHPGLTRALLALMPLLASVIAFTLLYALVPNRSVPVRHALAGGVLAALLFEVTKRGFAWYVTYFPSYEAIYGALAIIPIFLIWIYLSWLVTLLGAEFTYCLGIYRDGVHARHGQAGNRLLLALRLLECLWRAQRDGQLPDLEQLGAAATDVTPEEDLDAMLLELQNARLIARTDANTWVLTRDLSRLRLLDVYSAGTFVLPRPSLFAGLSRGPDKALAGIMRRIDQDIAAAMDVPLAQLFAAEPSESSEAA